MNINQFFWPESRLLAAFRKPFKHMSNSVTVSSWIFTETSTLITSTFQAYSDLTTLTAYESTTANTSPPSATLSIRYT